MINYIKSEVYRMLHSKGTHIFIIALSAFVVFLNIVLYIFGRKYNDFHFNNTNFVFGAFISSLVIVMAFSGQCVDIVFGKEYKNKTLKNTISFGISKNIVYFSKLVVSVIYSFIVGILVGGVLIISSYLLLENGDIEYLKLLINSLVCAIPIILICIVLAQALYFITDKEIIVVSLWISIVMVVPIILNMMGRRNDMARTIASYMPFNIIRDISFNEATQQVTLGWTTPDGILKSIIVAAIGCALFYFIGLEVFKRKEIK